MAHFGPEKPLSRTNRLRCRSCHCRSTSSSRYSHSLRAAGSLDDASLLLLCDPSIGSLNLRGARQLTGGGSLCHLDALCPRLATLDLSWCWQLEDADIAELPSSLAARVAFAARLPPPQRGRCLDARRPAPRTPMPAPLWLRRAGHRAAARAAASPRGALHLRHRARLEGARAAIRCMPVAAGDRAARQRGRRRRRRGHAAAPLRAAAALGPLRLRRRARHLSAARCRPREPAVTSAGQLWCRSAARCVRRPSRASRRVLRAGASALDGLAGQAGLVTGAVGGAPTVTGGLQRAAQWLRGGHDASSSDDNDSDEERPLDHALVGELTRGRSNGVGFPLLSRLVLVGGGWLRAPFVAAAAERCPALVELIIGVHGGLSPGGRFVRSPLPHLLELTLVRCEASATTLACLKACPHLRKLTLRRCAGFGAAAAEELHGLTELRTVALCGVKPTRRRRRRGERGGVARRRESRDTGARRARGRGEVWTPAPPVSRSTAGRAASPTLTHSS